MKALVCSSHPGPSVIGSRMPLSSSTGIITMLITGAITSSDLVVNASALEAAAQAPPTSRVRKMPYAIPATPPRMPITSPRPTRIIACTNSWSRSRISRPTSRAVREAGVTRSASTTPSRHSAINPKPAKNAPNMPSWTSSPGTRNMNSLSAAPGKLATRGSSNGPKRSR